MSTPRIDLQTFANIRATLKDRTATVGGCNHLTAEIFRAFDLDPWGRPNGDPEAPTNCRAAADNLTPAVTAAVFDWQRANWSAHVARYDGEAEKTIPSPRLPRGRDLNDAELLKALQCVRYNCDAGKSCAGTSFAASLPILDSLIDSLKDHLIDQIPAYVAAEWPL